MLWLQFGDNHAKDALGSIWRQIILTDKHDAISSYQCCDGLSLNYSSDYTHLKMKKQLQVNIYMCKFHFVSGTHKIAHFSQSENHIVH